MGGFYDGAIYDREEIRANIGEDFGRARSRLVYAESIAPGSTAPAIEALAAKEAEAAAAVDAVFDKEARRLEEARERNRVAGEAEDAASLAVCSHLCATIEEARRKATYVATIPSIVNTAHERALAFIRAAAVSPILA